MFQREIAAVEAAVTRAADLVQDFAEQDPADPEACWHDPSRMFEQMDEARNETMKAWKALQDAKQRQQEERDAPGLVDEQDFRAQYMDMVTSAFADVLNEMKERDDFDLDVLVDCLQSGIEILSQEDKEYLMMDENVVTRKQRAFENL